ncbi:MAG TPA: ABC transporter ATP-binding protein [Tepidisphaeraceae bacterium]|nr:ABC transporter ATP-binding protein [Tepidisphaeraceae bacterium]
MPIIELKNLHKRFGRLVVLNGLSLNIESGKCIVIIGASGSGKSVLLKHIVGLLQPDEGEVWFKGERIDNLPERQLMLIRKHFGFLFQMGALFDSANVFDNVAFPLVEHTKLSPEEIKRVVMEKLTLVGLPKIPQKMPAELSGGQRKRVALARAIALEPEVILYDEPTTGLDPVRADVINELIIKLQHHLNVTSIVVTHDMASAFKVGDRIVMLHEGKLIFDGTPQEIQRSEDPIVKRFVLGEASDEELAAVRANGNGGASAPIATD